MCVKNAKRRQKIITVCDSYRTLLHGSDDDCDLDSTTFRDLVDVCDSDRTLLHGSDDDCD